MQRLGHISLNTMDLHEKCITFVCEEQKNISTYFYCQTEKASILFWQWSKALYSFETSQQTRQQPSRKRECLKLHLLETFVHILPKIQATFCTIFHPWNEGLSFLLSSNNYHLSACNHLKFSARPKEASKSSDLQCHAWFPFLVFFS